MKFQIISDVHLEFDIKEILKEIPSLTETICLLGDIGIPSRQDYKDFIKKMSENFKTVIIITGNHEVLIYHYNKKKKVLP
jgi:metallophosphoesterase superfamily enzyme